MESWLARGAQPTPAGFRWLHEHGFRTAVNLREEDDTETYLDMPLAIRHVRIPVRDNGAPSDEQMQSWLTLCGQTSSRPIFVHCQSGHGRTSTFCILLRLAQGVRLSDAIEEQVKYYGFNPKHDKEQIAYLEDVKRRMKTGDLKLPAV